LIPVSLLVVRTAKNMSISVNGQSRVPPGFRFHPTEEELLDYYLRKKVASENIDLDVIRDVDLNKLEPWDIQDMCRIGSTHQMDWYFFSHKDKKYPTGTRTNRATAAGFWKATGRDKVIYASFQRIGMRKTLVFYKGRAPHGQKSDWIMYEYRLDECQDADSKSLSSRSSFGETATQEEGWVVCRVFKKKNHHKGLDTTKNASSINLDAKEQMIQSGNDEDLDQILRYMGRSYIQETSHKASTVDAINPTPLTTSTHNISSSHMRYLRANETTTVTELEESFMKLPALENPGLTPLPSDCTPPGGNSCTSQLSHPSDGLQAVVSMQREYNNEPTVSDWAALDKFVASHLNGQADVSRQLASCFEDTADQFGFGVATGPLPNAGASSTRDCHHGDIDLWTFVRSASSASPGRPCHVPRASA
ncbi:hypothetical protein Taro_035425, partial [Colocasia esculenta]|nr:hypothetical protein [Colocasia esculenta]